MPGPVTSVAEVTHVSRHGFWLLLDAEDLLVPTISTGRNSTSIFQLNRFAIRRPFRWCRGLLTDVLKGPRVATPEPEPIDAH